MPVCTGVPGFAVKRANVATGAPPRPVTVTVAPGVPASWRSYACSSPVWPTRSPAA